MNKQIQWAVNENIAKVKIEGLEPVLNRLIAGGHPDLAAAVKDTWQKTTKKIILPDQHAYDVLKDMVSVDFFDGKCFITAPERAYPDSPNDIKIVVTIGGREKDLHALAAVAWMTYRVAEWKKDRY